MAALPSPNSGQRPRVDVPLGLTGHGRYAEFQSALRPLRAEVQLGGHGPGCPSMLFADPPQRISPVPVPEPAEFAALAAIVEGTAEGTGDEFFQNSCNILSRYRRGLRDDRRVRRRESCPYARILGKGSSGRELRIRFAGDSVRRRRSRKPLSSSDRRPHQLSE